MVVDTVGRAEAMRDRSDGELARAWASGDARAFDETYRRHAPALYDTAVALLADRDAAAGAVHDTFVRAVPRIRTLQQPERMRAWLFALLRNEVCVARAASGAADGDPGAREREVLQLHLHGGLDARDLGDVLGVGAGHAGFLLSRMRDRLEQLAPGGVPAPDPLPATLRPQLIASVKQLNPRVAQPDTSGWVWRPDGFPYPADGDAELVTAGHYDEPSSSAHSFARRSAGPARRHRSTAAPARSRREMALAATAVVALGLGVVGISQWRGHDSAQPVLTAPPSVPVALAEASATEATAPDAAAETSRPTGSAGAAPAASGSASGVASRSASRGPSGGPTLAGAASPVPARPAATPAAATTKVTVALSVPPPVPTPPAPPSPTPSPPPVSGITVSAPALDLGAGVTNASVTIGVRGPVAVPVTASISGAGLSVNGTSAVVQPGASVNLTVQLDRSLLPEGNVSGSLQLRGGVDTITIPVTARVERAPQIQRLAVSQSRVGVGRCNPSTAQVQVTYTDESPVTGTMTWKPDGVTSITTALTRSGATLVATVGPFSRTGTASIAVTLTDSRGNQSSSGASLPVVNCYFGFPA